VLREPGVKPAADDPHADVAAALHDVSNALTIILGWVSEARAEPVDPLAVRHALQVIEEQARIARSLARSAIGAAPSEVDLEEPLDSVVGSAISALAIEAASAGVELVTETAGALARVARASDVRQIVTNLVLNALAFSPRGGRVVVGLDVTPSSAVATVQDDGPGIPIERRTRVFEGESTRQGGGGIGLRHARSLARAAGGTLDLLDSPRGARFRLTWPRARSRSIMPPPSRSLAVLEGTRVLLVEDDEHVTLLLGTALGARGAVVTIARDRDELTRALAEGDHDAALIDLSPIASDVRGAVEALRRRSPRAALVFISGSSVGLPDALADAGVLWVRKPFEVGEVVAAVLKARAGVVAASDE
jgi:CheY-like chemotaxis protein/two-component sensor histidine kinase